MKDKKLTIRTEKNILEQFKRICFEREMNQGEVLEMLLDYYKGEVNKYEKL